MSNHLPSGAVHVNDLRLWAHVGVLEQERLLGQWFSLDFSLWLELDIASKTDDLEKTADYSLAIKKIQELTFQLNCKTIEHFSELILCCLEDVYGIVPMRVLLRKCAPPIAGFNGTVSVERRLHWPTT